MPTNLNPLLPPIALNTAVIRQTALADKVVLVGRHGIEGLEMWTHEIPGRRAFQTAADELSQASGRGSAAQESGVA